MTTISERFLNYTKINTTTDTLAGSQGVMPSSRGQWVLGELLVKELQDLGGMIEIEQRSNGIVTATLPSNLPCPDNRKIIAFFAHLDTSSEHTADTKAQLVDYNGGDIPLANGLILREKDNPELKNYVNDKIFVSDGESLLGSDDKAAIAAIMDMLQYFIEHPEIPHGTVKVGFVPDEEQGLLGAKAFNTPDFADFGYTLDCCGIGEFIFENWNAGHAEIEFIGQSAHPMNSKGNMKNSLLMAMQFAQLFPRLESPENTEQREGYYWVKKMTGNTAKTLLHIDVRDFTAEGYNARMQFIKDAIASYQALYGKERIQAKIVDSYENVANYLSQDEDPQSPINLALNAYKENGIEPKIIPMRGGYDGAVFSQHGIPCPNIFTGGHNFHSVFEYLPLKSLQAASAVIQTIVKNLAK